VRILTPNDSSIKESLQGLKDNSVNIKYIEPKSGIIIKTILVDKKHSLIMELKDKEDPGEKEFSTIPKKTIKVIARESLVEIGTSTYSNSKPTVLSYLSVFETLRRQTELFEQLKQSDILKTEFNNIAAHELRTPTQTILGYCEMIDIFPEKKMNT
jgi:two-component system, OmpR family, sensor histidine kinase VicK